MLGRIVRPAVALVLACAVVSGIAAVILLLANVQTMRPLLSGGTVTARPLHGAADVPW
ncbi:hypothetical protein ACWGQ5_46505 [Streptomyces sp. NPDC055722]